MALFNHHATMSLGDIPPQLFIPLLRRSPSTPANLLVHCSVWGLNLKTPAALYDKMRHPGYHPTPLTLLSHSHSCYLSLCSGDPLVTYESLSRPEEDHCSVTRVDCKRCSRSLRIKVGDNIDLTYYNT